MWLGLEKCPDELCEYGLCENGLFESGLCEKAPVGLMCLFELEACKREPLGFEKFGSASETFPNNPVRCCWSAFCLLARFKLAGNVPLNDANVPLKGRNVPLTGSPTSGGLVNSQTATKQANPKNNYILFHLP